MSYTFLLGQLPNVASVLEDAIAEFEYYAAYDPDVINCAIAFAIFKPLEMTFTFGIECLSTFFNGDRKLIQKAS
ncbi:hypothetical protein [Pseudanabaena sp. BC1403]|uniref:hypothetical protein n=1 Tax=Pseudanabaena sp. BC1403 TaxID=2043171 RepID=UPI000CD8974C|nr:hypothetical protein [Pseudanabaena sp. BC1403]